MIINSLRMAWMYCIIGGRWQQVRLYFGCWNRLLFYLPKSSNFFLMLLSGPSETLLENRHFLRSNSIRSLQIENEKGPDRHPIFVNQMYNLVKPLAHQTD